MPTDSLINEKACWFAWFDPEVKAWRPLFCVPSYAKWTDVKISDKVGDCLLSLRKIECVGATAAEIEAAVLAQYAKESHVHTSNGRL